MRCLRQTHPVMHILLNSRARLHCIRPWLWDSVHLGQVGVTKNIGKKATTLCGMQAESDITIVQVTETV